MPDLNLILGDGPFSIKDAMRYYRELGDKVCDDELDEEARSLLDGFYGEMPELAVVSAAVVLTLFAAVRSSSVPLDDQMALLGRVLVETTQRMAMIACCDAL